ncbi:ABC transporter ATP-binding protein [Blastococcus haudaquaticus]|uniref:Iron(III) transport system ATP-binding protein n=1 Tax=Blastococcus haudaquaticus TaxID=1938745 RepID=A0A286GHX5_9ACTN|nr:ABC transporter ATP-binding protein [Blastococcus haudaquaticus]SOD94709.1 iron(III) transport system ATP-binding protein [Blastococcus haudaquaticus]
MLRIHNLIKSFAGEKSRGKKKDEAGHSAVFAVNDVSFEVKEGELFTLLGPSGCGKTTTLRSIAGLEKPDSGTIAVGDRVMFSSTGSGRSVNLPANQRGLGMVFQSYAIWPHMTVFDNVAFPLQVRPRGQRPAKKEISERVERVLATMQLSEQSGRQATKLSGGQQQRLALARALVIEPPLLLLDEPLSNLDAKLRESLRYELKRLQRELGITSVYVTHDQVEALALSTQIAVMERGAVVQLGKPREVYEQPANKFVAEFIGTSNFIPGTVASQQAGRHCVETSNGTLFLESAHHMPVGSEVVVSIRPEAVELSTVSRGEQAANEWTGEVVARAFLGDAVDHVVSVGQHEVRARVNPSVSIESGTPVYLQLDPSKISLVPVN